MNMSDNNNKYTLWSDKSKDIPFKSQKKGIGNGEEKVKKELNILSSVGGQNSTYDLIDQNGVKISVKDMTKSDCTLGVNGSTDMRKILFDIICIFIQWTKKYKDECKLANYFYNNINKKYGKSKKTMLECIYRLELSKTNLLKLNKLLFKLKYEYLIYKKLNNSLESEYIEDIINELNNNTLMELLDNCVRREAQRMKLIIVHEERGWVIIDNINDLNCPRITRGAPRINYIHR